MEFWIHKNGQLAGRFSESDIRGKLADGSFSAADLAWSDAKTAWQPIPEFLESLPAASAQSVTVAPPTEKSADEVATVPVEKAATEPEEKVAPKPETEILRPSTGDGPSLPRHEGVPSPGAKPPPLPTTSTPIPAPTPASRPPPLPSMATPSVAPGPGSSIPATASISAT